MKKFSLLILSVLLLSCSSDNNEDAVTKEDNFLDVYNGVVWMNYIERLKVSYWFVYTPNSKTEAEGIEGMDCSPYTVKWGVEDSNGDKYTIKENSNNLLIYDYKCGEIVDESGEDCSFTRTITVSENGNVLNISNSDGSSEIVNRVTTKPCE